MVKSRSDLGVDQTLVKNRTDLGLARRAKAILNLLSTYQVKHVTQKLARREQELAALRTILAKKDAGDQDVGVKPENIIWVFGSGRTGSSWLTFMMGALSDHTRWNEPLVGHLFGHLYYGERDEDTSRAELRRDRKHFILGSGYEEFWLNSIRNLVLKGATARFPERAEKGYVVIKEPHGSIGAPLLMKALPESRMIFLTRDPRDVAASALQVSFVPKGRRNRTSRVTKADERPEGIVKARAKSYWRDIRHTREAFEAHTGHKVLIRYEDLRADTLESMKRIYSTLAIPVDERELARVVETRSWENIPEDEKGEGTIRRKATPGGWREDLTPEQIAIVEREAAPILNEFYAED
jgi:hypothetical protein